MASRSELLSKVGSMMPDPPSPDDLEKEKAEAEERRKAEGKKRLEGANPKKPLVIPVAGTSF